MANPFAFFIGLFGWINPNSALRAKNELLTEEKRVLSAESAILKAENAALKTENQKLREELEKREIADAKAAQDKQNSDKDRTDEEYQILAVIVGRREVAVFGIAHHMGDMVGKTSERITLLLKRLKGDGLVWESMEGRWALTDGGREHLHARGKL